MRSNYYLAFKILIISWLLTSCVNSEISGNETVLITNETKQPKTFSTPDASISEGWILFPPPKENSEERSCANWAITNEHKVENENGNVKFSKYIDEDDEQLYKLPAKLKEQILKKRNIGEGLGGHLHIESYQNGWLIGSDAGEWGGKLFWFSEIGNQKIELLEDNVRGIAKVGDDVFILSGLAHLGIDEGKIYKLTKDDKENLKIQQIADFKTQPQTFIIENNQSILITLRNKILRLKTSGEIETLKEVNLEFLYPNSMAVTSSGIIYVGMRLFVVRLVPGETGYNEEWLVPRNCQRFNKKDYGCVCLD